MILEKRKTAFLVATDRLITAVVNRENEQYVVRRRWSLFHRSFLSRRIRQSYVNTHSIDRSCKQLTMQSNLLLKQSQCWTQLIGQLTMALKVSSRFSLTLNFTVFECLREGTRRC